MKVEVVESFYAKDVIFDAPVLSLQKYRMPLYIGARKGQVGRVHKLLHEKKIRGTSIGVWELGSLGYLNPNGTINVNAFKQHGVVVMAQPERVPAEFRDAYIKLIQALEKI